MTICPKCNCSEITHKYKTFNDLKRIYEYLVYECHCGYQTSKRIAEERE